MTSNRDFRKLLEEDRLIVFDGGMGTELYNRGVFINACYDNVNLSNPKMVQEIHESYISNGSDVISTNTFGANPFKLKEYRCSKQIYEINFEGAKIARKAAGDNIFVAGSIGPLGIKIEPYGPTSFEEAKNAFKQQVQPLLEGGVDLFLVETFTDLSELQQAVLAIKEVCDYPIIATVTVSDDGHTIYGTPAERFTRYLNELNIDMIGVNCSVGPKVMLDVVQEMQKYSNKPIIAQPNAGSPRIFQDRMIYMCSPEYMASYARKFIKSGVRAVGGCCGTSPGHIKEISRSVKAMQPMRTSLNKPKTLNFQEKELHVQPIETSEKCLFAKRMLNGELVISIELTPPKGCNPKRILKRAGILYEKGIDAINIPDGPRASSRMSNQILALLIHNQIGIEPIPHYCCRDRNLLGMQSDILGLYAAGIHNILVVTGDPPKLGDYPDATAVFDVDAIGLTNIVYGLNHGYDLGHNPIKKPTGFFIGVGANPVATDLEREIKRFKYKVEAGAEYAITQPVFDVEAFKSFLKAIDSHKIPIVAGIWPLASFKNAEFMKNEVPGVVIPDEIMERMEKAEAEERAGKEGIIIAQEMIEELKPIIHGVQVSAPFGKIESALEVVKVVNS